VSVRRAPVRRVTRINASKGFRQTGLCKDTISCMPAYNPDRHREPAFGDGAIPNLMATLACANKHAAGPHQQPPQLAIEGCRHSRRSDHRYRLHTLADKVQFDFVARRGKSVFCRNVGRNFEDPRNELLKCSRLGRQRQLVVAAPPDRGFAIPSRPNLEDLSRLHHLVFARDSHLTSKNGSGRRRYQTTDHTWAPTKANPLGVKGAGEAGNVGALAAITNAVVDALSPLGITHIDMPATPERVWRAIRAEQAHSAA